MLRALVAFSLKFRGVVLTLACVLLAYGFYVTINARLDVFPNFVQPQVAIQTECAGLSPEQVELLVTTPIETMINGLGEMESLRSESIEGLSVITAVFKENSDVFRARQTLGEKLAEMAGVLPATVKTPRMTPLTSSTMDLLKIGLISTNLTPMQLRSFADWTLKPRLLSVPGVAKCSTFGGEVRQIQIQVSPERLNAYGLSLSDVIAAARLSTGVMGAGFIETRNQRITLQTEGQALNAAELQGVVIGQTNGVPVRLQDVAQVVEGAEPKFGDAIIQGRPAVLLTFSSQYNANTLEVTRDVEAALKGLKPIFDTEHIEVLPRLHRPATFIEISIAHMKHSLALGALFVAIVLFTMLGSIRTAFISLVAIPLSLLSAIVVLQRFGITLNTITLGGLAIALGEVVDDSIIDVENIFRRLREYRARKRAESTGPEAPAARLNARELFDVVLSASLEVRSAVVYATFIVALVFLPVLTLTGLQGSFFAPLALSYILAIMASLLVALTVTPALASITLTWKTRADREPRLQHWFKGGYGRVLGLVSLWPKLTIGAALLFCIGAACCIPFFGGELLPQFREGHFVLQVFGAPGTSLPEMARLGARISTELLANPHIDTVSQQIGRAELGEDAWPPSRCEFHVELKPTPGREQQKMTDELRGILEKFPGIEFEVLTFLGDRISETISGETEPVVVNITGDDLDLLDEKAGEVVKVLKSIPGNADVKIKAPTGSPRIVIRLRNDRLSQFGFRPVEVMDAIQTAYHGAIVAQTHRQNQVADVAVVLAQADRTDPEAIGSLLVTASSSGTRLPLSELADIYPTSGRFTIQHEAVRRRQVVTCATRPGRDVASFTQEAKKLIAQKVPLPIGTTAEVTGAAEAESKAQNELFLNSAVAAVGIIMLLTVVLHNARNLFLVLLNIPFALAGGVLAVWLSNVLLGQEQTLSIGSLVGFVTLFGITMRNSIMLISHFEHLVTEEGMTWGEAAAVRGASERLMPILITAIVTALGLLPLAIGAGEAGREIEGPMAMVILGGLVTSTALNLLVLPTLALRYGRFAKPA
jgi:CzcA family heavy metal efflux pump